MRTPLLDKVYENVKRASADREQLVQAIRVLKRLGGNVNSHEVQLHNIDEQIAKQTQVLKEEGYTF